MLCPKCGKESNNLRVCGFCHTPYPTDASGKVLTPRSTRSVPTPRASAAVGAGNPRFAMAQRARTRRWVAIGVLAVFTVGFYFATRDRVIPVGVALPNLIAAPMSAGEAGRVLQRVNGTAQVDVRNGAVTVRVSAATFPERRDGQLAFAQQYARADELVQGHKRPITFLDPGGSEFAKADPDKGVLMTR
jgi:hypothetical protein